MRALTFRRGVCSLVCLALALTLLAGCAVNAPVPAAAADGADPIVVFAAASLTDAFNDIGKQFTGETGIPVAFNFAGSQQLRGQLLQGAEADVFAPANLREMTAAIGAGLVITGTDQVFARNRLVVIYPKANPGRAQGLADLAAPGLKLVVADRATPVGQYTMDMLEEMAQDAAFGSEFAARALKNVVSYEQNVKAVVSKVQLGEADAGVVYATDVTAAAREKVSALEVPDAFNQIATYPIAALAGSKDPAQANRFVAFVLSDAGQAILAQRGFLPARDQ